MRAARLDTAIWLGVACLTVASCSLLFPAEPEPEGRALLNQIPRELPRRAHRAATVLVLPPDTVPTYDTPQMAYETRPHEVSYFTRREWGETPSEMLNPLLVKTLENTRSFAAVVVPPYTNRYSYALRTKVLELSQDFTRHPATLMLSLRFRLTDDTGRVIATKEISVSEPMQHENSSAGVVAANEATAKALWEMATFVIDTAH